MESSSGNVEEWMEIATTKQFELNDILGSRRWDKIKKNDLFLLKRKIGFAACGNPKDMPQCNNYCTGYGDDDLEMIKAISQQIINISEHDPVLFACTFLIVYWENSLASVPVFRVVNNDKNVFVDTNGRVYKTWESFVGNNQLPKCIYCAPKNGEYISNSILELQFIKSPTCKLINQALDHVDTVATVAAIGATVTSFFVAAPILIPVLGVSAAYNTVRSANTLYDRRNHEQSINLNIREARSAWLNIAGSAVGFGAAAAFSKASKIVDGGEKLSKLSVFGIRALNTSTLVFNGFGFVDNLLLCKEKYMKGILTPLDVFHLSCEVLFFYNAVSSVQATSNMLNQMEQLKVSQGSKNNVKLTKSQKRNLRRKINWQKAKLSNLNANAENSQNITTGGKILSMLTVTILSKIIGAVPSFEEILYQYQSIGHDLKCWLNGEITNEELFSSCLYKLPNLYKQIMEDIKFMKEVIQNLRLKMKEYFNVASSEQQKQFCISIKNLEYRIESIIKNANEEITLLSDPLPEINSEEGSECIEQSLLGDESNDEEIALETCDMLKKIDELIVSNFQCNSLEDYQYIVESVEAVVIEDFVDKLEHYKISVKAAKNSSAGFNLDIYNKELGIEEDCGQHFYNQTLNSIHCRKLILKIKNALHENRTNHRQNTNILQGFGNAFSFESKEEMSEEEILCMIQNKLKLNNLNKNSLNIFKRQFQEENLTILFLHPNVDMELKGIVVYYKYNEDNTISGLFNLYE